MTEEAKPIPYVFDNTTSDDCPINQMLYSAADYNDFTDASLTERNLKLISQNWRADPSVSNARQQELKRLSPFSSNPSLSRALSESRKQSQMSGPESEPFYRANSNHKNLLFRKSVRNRDKQLHMFGISPKTELFRIISLWHSTFPIMRRPKHMQIELDSLGIANKLEEASAGVEVSEKLADLIMKSEQRERIVIVNYLLRSLDAKKIQDLEPWWSTRYDNTSFFRILTSDNWEPLIASLGMGLSPPHAQLIGIVFPAEAAGSLYRPTALDAFDYTYFHPSESNSDFGRSLALSSEHSSLAEYIHPVLQSLFFEECKVFVGSSGHDKSLYENDLPEYRNKHQGILYRMSSNIASWISRHWGVDYE